MTETYTLLQKILITILCTTTLLEIAYYTSTFISIFKIKLKLNKQNTDKSAPKVQPGVSIIIYAKNESENIHNFLPLFLEQKYPDYEVIVVNDGSTDNTIEEIVSLKKTYNHLQFTNIPEQTITLSHKQLAITIGIKTAQKEFLIFTDMDTRPWTPHWISNIIKSYKSDTDFILGYNGYYSNKNILSQMMIYDTITMSIRNFNLKPRIAFNKNISFKRSSFFSNKGFAGFLHIDSGDNDLLANHYGTQTNTIVQPLLEAKTISVPKTNFKDWYYLKKKYIKSLTNYKTKSRLSIIIEPIIRCLFWISAIVTLILFWDSKLVLAIIGISTLLKLLTQFIIINQTASYYKERKINIILIVLFDIFLPLVAIYATTIGKCFTKRIKWR